MIASLIMPTQMRYFDLPRYWTRDIVPHLGDERLNAILVSDVNEYTYGRWKIPFTHGRFPCEFDTTDWGFDRRGRWPRYWKYTLGCACHWLVNFNLKLATLVRPRRAWRILTSAEHSTVWDGRRTLFEFNFLAAGIDPDKCFGLAYGRELAVGEFRKVSYAGYYPEERAGA